MRAIFTDVNIRYIIMQASGLAALQGAGLTDSGIWQASMTYSLYTLKKGGVE
jgi:hypothetical protein